MTDGALSDRIWNFSAGPAVLPEPVLRQAQEDLWNTRGSGVGIAEHSHRGKVYETINAEAEVRCRELAGIPGNYKVLFLQGGASLQFAMVPMNLLPPGRVADYIVTGIWAQKAIKEARQVGQVHSAFDGAAEQYRRIPSADQLAFSPDPAYVHLTTNNTIYGTQWRSEPPVPATAPLVADTSSDMFSRPIDVSKYGLIYAGAQKNLGPSGIVLVIVREDLIERAPSTLPNILQYRVHAKEKSLFNTPNTFGVYLMGEVFRWLQAEGGLDGMARRNAEKARLVYDVIDSTDFWRGTADAGSRSLMNVCFRAPSEELEARFCAEATQAGLDGLKGHRSAGGMRASIYNACPRAAVEALVQFMKEFERRA
ncbi:MAG TPA: 3-phosphoserine/phosphohydroxythreonine transaminase [Gemmatimonadales bacterium]